jgi:hypothetical protein
MTGVWRTFPDFDGIYKISEKGDVLSTHRMKHRLLKAHRDKDGYWQVRLSLSKRTRAYRVHWLVCVAFHGKPKPGEQASHLDGDKNNNCADNLRWMSPKANNLLKREHGTSRSPARQGENNPRVKLSDRQVDEIRSRYLSGEPSRPLARAFSVSQTSIVRIGRGERRSSQTPAISRKASPKTSRGNP